jgi:hypothetical protein
LHSEPALDEAIDVNRDPESADTVELKLRDGTFAGPAGVLTMTGADRAANIFASGTADIPGVEIDGVNSEDGADQPRGDVLIVKAPPSSFTVIEVAIAVR